MKSHILPLKLPNGSDHAVIACYLGLYEEGEVEHINGVRPSFLENTAVSRSVIFAHATHVEQYACAKKLINAASW